MTKSVVRVQRVETRLRKLSKLESFSKEEYAKVLKFDLLLDIIRMEYGMKESKEIIIELIKKIDI